MAEINTRLHYKINGVTDEIKCYTTLAEVQNQGIPVRVGGVAGYAKYGPASDANASRGNYKPPGGTAQRILKQAQIPYGSQLYTAPGTYTFTVPAGAGTLQISGRGGGGCGGLGDFWYDAGDNLRTWTGGKGGNGGSVNKRRITVSAGSTYTVIIGAGGILTAKNGGNTVFGEILTITGGEGGVNASFANGRNGANGTPSEAYAEYQTYGVGGAGAWSNRRPTLGAGGMMKIEWGGSI